MFLRLTEYHRPSTLVEALALLSRPSPVTRPLAGGTSLTGGVDDEVEAVVDLADLGFGSVESGRIGAMATLQEIADSPRAPDCLRQAARASAPRTIRVAATLGGTLIAPDGGLAVPAALGALRARRETEGPLVTAIAFAPPRRSAFVKVARTPADAPIVCAAACLDGEGAITLAVAGAAADILVVTGTAAAVGDRFAEALHGARSAGDWVAPDDYRREAGEVLARRALEALGGGA